MKEPYRPTTLMQIGVPYRVADILSKAHGQADWELVESVYRQCIEISEDLAGTYMPDKLVSFLAEALWRVSASYAEAEELLILHSLAVLGNVERQELLTKTLFSDLYSDLRFERFARYAPKGIAGKRRRPRPFESLVETARRLRDANKLKDVLKTTRTSGVLGGSTSYGRFFNVCGARDSHQASDLDMMIILPDFGLLPEVCDALTRLPSTSEKATDLLSERAEKFVGQDLDDGRTIMSHKLELWRDVNDPIMAWAGLPGSYFLSLHFLSLPTLQYLLVSSSAKLMAENAGAWRTVRDYREEAGTREDHQRSFSGRNQRLELKADEVAGGFVRTSRVYAIDADDRYYPGMFQNMFLPRFDLRWDRVDIERQLQVFKWKIIERIRYERRIRPHEFLRVSLAHTRSEFFAPHVLEMIDTGLTSS